MYIIYLIIPHSLNISFYDLFTLVFIIEKDEYREENKEYLKYPT